MLTIVSNNIVKISVLSVLFLALTACDDDRFSVVQDENRLLKRELAEQRRALNALVEKVASIETISTPSFLVSEIDLEVKERMFDPVINGRFLMEVKGESLPGVVYLELEIKTKAKDNEHEYSQNVIHRFMPGSSKDNYVEFTHPLKLHKVKSDDVELKVTPLTWYKGYQVN